MSSWWEQARSFNSTVRRRTSGEIDEWLTELSGHVCACCEAMTRWEYFNGRCEQCMYKTMPADAPRMGGCSCAGVPGSEYGYHFNYDGDIYERCPRYWERAGWAAVRENRDDPINRWRRRKSFGRLRLVKQGQAIER